MSQCASGCTIRGHHLAECNGWAWGRDECGQPEEVECAGCLPRQAEFGVLCSWCWGRLQSSVRTLPSLVEHLFDMGAPSLRSPLGRPGGGRPTPGSRCLYSDALVAADGLHAILGTYAQEVAVEHPAAGSLPMGLCRWSQGRPAAGPLGWADVVDGGADPVILGPREQEDTRRLVAWLIPHLEWIASRPWATDMIADLASAASRALARWPIQEPERRITNVRCPSCGAWSLVLIPPSVPGAERLVRCTLPACGSVLTEEDWNRTRNWALAVAQATQTEVAAP